MERSWSPRSASVWCRCSIGLRRCSRVVAYLLTSQLRRSSMIRRPDLDNASTSGKETGQRDILVDIRIMRPFLDSDQSPKDLVLNGARSARRHDISRPHNPPTSPSSSYGALEILARSHKNSQSDNTTESLCCRAVARADLLARPKLALPTSAERI
jgi:hypothetical protein